MSVMHTGWDLDRCHKKKRFNGQTFHQDVQAVGFLGDGWPWIMECCAACHIVEEDCPARLLILDSPACRQLVRDGALGAEKEGIVVGGKV